MTHTHIHTHTHTYTRTHTAVWQATARDGRMSGDGGIQQVCMCVCMCVCVCVYTFISISDKITQNVWRLSDAAGGDTYAICYMECIIVSIYFDPHNFHNTRDLRILFRLIYHLVPKCIVNSKNSVIHVKSNKSKLEKHNIVHKNGKGRSKWKQ